MALVVFGPRRLPQIGRQIGKLMYEFRKASNDFKFQMEEELRVSEEADRRKKEDEERARNLALNPPAQSSTQPQTIEAQADVGAVEQASVSAQPPATGAGLTSENPGDVAATGTATEDTGSRVYPRISPPSTGETVAASRYGAAGLPEANPETSPDMAVETNVAAEANIGAEPAPAAGEKPAGGSSSDPTRTETVSQHG
jgi:sec-independent protein translocase protein TatB